MGFVNLSLKDIVGLIADFMAIFGIGGFFTWSFVKKDTGSRSLEDVGISIFAFSIKLVLCFFAFLVISISALNLYYWLEYVFSFTISVGGGSYDLSSTELPNIIGIVISLLLWTPILILVFSSIILWSMKPFKRFWQVFTTFNRSSS